MAGTDLIVPIVIAVIGLLGSAVSLFMGWRSQMKVERYKADLEHGQTVSVLREKYSQPLLVAAYDLQQRLYELVEFPISRQHLEKKVGIEDLKKFTCYLLAQYLASTYILRTKTGYLSFSKDEKLARLRKMMYIIDEELDRRRAKDGTNVGVWPAARILVSERMLAKTKLDLNAALDGGLGVEVKGFDVFLKEWDQEFKEPMGFFCEWIDLALEGRLHEREGDEAPIRHLQHLLVDFVYELDRDHAYIPLSMKPAYFKCKKAYDCDCSEEVCSKAPNPRTHQDYDEILKRRQKSRLYDYGLWSLYGKAKWDPRGVDGKTSKEEIDLGEIKKETHTVDLRLDNKKPAFPE